jgi:mercuric ion binding protein
MKTFLSALVVAGAVVAAPAALAAERTVIFAVDNMTCASCPYIVKSSMTAVPGVAKVAVSFEAKTATVTFDNGRTNAEAIAAASANAGYPAHLRQQGS